MIKTKQHKFSLALPATFLWIGFVSAISFMEAWLKFRAPGVTLPIGLSIGTLVFGALNKVEWTLAILILLDIFLFTKQYRTKTTALLCVVILILIIQTLWLLPTLSARVALYEQGIEVAHSPVHFYYIGSEIIKVVCLFIISIRFLKLHGRIA